MAEEHIDRRKVLCDATTCPATAMNSKLDILTLKLDALNPIVLEMEALKKGFSVTWKIIAGVGAGSSMLFGVYTFLKEHWKP
jgi:hypothetical protein